MKSTRHAGVSFLNGQIQIAEIEHGKKLTVTALGERATSIDFADVNGTLSQAHPSLSAFAGELGGLLKQEKIEAEFISFALPTEPVFINVIPVDATLEGAELASHLQWELEQFEPHIPAKDCIISAQPLPGGDGETRNVFVVSVHRGTVGFLKKAASGLKSKLKFVDVDHFSSEKSLRFNYPELKEKVVMLIGLRRGRIDASLVLGGEVRDYRGYVTPGPQEVKTASGRYLESMKEQGNEMPAKVILHGIDATYGIISLIQQEIGIETLPLDAVRKLSPSKALREAYGSESSRFAAAIGLALRAPA